MYKVADEVQLKIRDNTLVSSCEKIYDFIKAMEIVSKNDQGYFLYIPSTIHLTGGISIDRQALKRYNISERFLDGRAIFVSEDYIVGLHKRMDGESCDRCNEFSYLAERDKDGAFKCFSCRKYRFR